MQRGCNDNMTPDILSFLSLPITSKLLYEEFSIVQVETLIWVRGVLTFKSLYDQL